MDPGPLPFTGQDGQVSPHRDLGDTESVGELDHLGALVGAHRPEDQLPTPRREHTLSFERGRLCKPYISQGVPDSSRYSFTAPSTIPRMK